ncbi:MAG: prolipoprotein diacylglyceryl transferase [Tepidiformaceae bacterium]
MEQLLALSNLVHFLVIDIGIDPEIGTFGPFTITWHGFFTAVGILAGVTLSVWLISKDGVPSDVGQEIAIVGVLSAIAGARLFYVAEHWNDQFADDPGAILFGIQEGGITLYGGLIGGVVGGVIYGIFRKWPIAIGLDAAAPGMILGQGIGRIGDLINGEHLATASDLPWAVRYTNLNNNLAELGVAVHPTAGGYELIGDMVILGLLLFVGRRFIKVPGWTFCMYVILYASMRFVLSYYRLDEQTIGDVPIPQIVSAALVGIAIIAAGVLLRHPGPITREYAARVWGTGKDKDKDGPLDDGQAAPA